MRIALIAVLLASSCLVCEAADKQKQKDYPLALEIFETRSGESAHDLTLAKASDGNLYAISCPAPGGGIVGMLTDPHCSDVAMVPGSTYRARWNRGQLKVLIPPDKSGGRQREATFTVLHSKKMTAEEMESCKVCVLVKEP